MDPVIFEIGGISLRWYGFMAALGFLTAIFIMNRNRQYAKLSADQVSNVCMIAIFAGLIGARIFYVILKWNEHFRYYPMDIIRVDKGGLVFYGGFVLAMASLWYYIHKICKADPVRVLDIVAPALAAAHALGRIGCFITGCCFGKPSNLTLVAVYKIGTEPFKKYGSQPLHPVQLYETILNIILAAILFYLVRKGKRGVAMASYILAYGILRFFDEFFRGDHPDNELVLGIFTPAQAIGFIMIPAGIALLVYFIWFQKKTDEDENTNEPDKQDKKAEKTKKAA